MKNSYFISALDIVEFKPIFPIFHDESATLELIKTHYPDAPIEGKVAFSIKENYKITKVARPDKNGFDFIFEDKEN